jgi:hypothetical protein
MQKFFGGSSAAEPKQGLIFLHNMIIVCLTFAFNLAARSGRNRETQLIDDGI